jgi:hypothetical protein
MESSHQQRSNFVRIAFAREGATLYFLGRTLDTLHKVVREIS